MSPLTAFCLIALVVGAVLCEKFQQDVGPTVFEDIAEWEGRIVGGRNAAPGQFPYHVGLRRPNGHICCGGSILSAHFVLTAAACFQQPGFRFPREVRVVVGSHRHVNDGIVHTVAGILRHPGFNDRSIMNDIAIVRTQNPILFNSAHVRAIKLPNRPVPDNFPLVLTGWGTTANNQHRHPEILQFLVTTSLNRQKCRERFGPNSALLVRENSICTANPVGRGACMGDLGGPLVGQDGVQYGILSWGEPCARGRPDVYTSVFHHLQWIQAAIR